MSHALFSNPGAPLSQSASEQLTKRHGDREKEPRYRVHAQGPSEGWGPVSTCSVSLYNVHHGVALILGTSLLTSKQFSWERQNLG